MPTNPPLQLYDRAFASAAVHDLATKAGPALQEIIDQAAAILARCWVSAVDGDTPLEPHVPVFVTYHVLIEMLDGAAALLQNGKATAAGLLLRSAWEAGIQIEYLCERDADQRAYAFLVSDIRRRIRIYERFVPGTAGFEAIEAARRSDSNRLSYLRPVIADGQQGIAGLRDILSKPGWREANAEWKRTRKANNGNRPNWYSLYGGPDSVRALAEHLRRLEEYAVLYERWSGTAHAFEPERILSHDHGSLAFAVMPSSSLTKTAYGLAMTFGLRAARIVLRRYRGEQSFLSSWYTQEIRDAFLGVVGGDATQP